MKDIDSCVTVATATVTKVSNVEGIPYILILELQLFNTTARFPKKVLESGRIPLLTSTLSYPLEKLSKLEPSTLGKSSRFSRLDDDFDVDAAGSFMVEKSLWHPIGWANWYYKSNAIRDIVMITWSCNFSKTYHSWRFYFLCALVDRMWHTTLAQQTLPPQHWTLCKKGQVILLPRIWPKVQVTGGLGSKMLKVKHPKKIKTRLNYSSPMSMVEVFSAWKPGNLSCEEFIL